jgi:hypothetical protein
MARTCSIMEPKRPLRVLSLLSAFFEHGGDGGEAGGMTSWRGVEHDDGELYRFDVSAGIRTVRKIELLLGMASLGCRMRYPASRIPSPCSGPLRESGLVV